MNKTLDPTAAVHWLAARLAQPQWSQAQAVVAGTLGERRVRARRFGSGLAIAVSLDWPVKQAAHVCLLLAALPEACDDAIYLADAQLWLLRRYPAALTEVELDLLLKQQQSVAALLAVRERAVPAPAPSIGRLA